MNERFVSVLVCSGLLLGGCAVGPDYVERELPKPDYAGALAATGTEGGSAVTPEELASWWALFNDPEITGLIETALRKNPGMKGALAKIEQTRAQVAIVKGGLFPQVDGAVAYSRALKSENTTLPPAPIVPGNYYMGALDAAWEIDLFGGTRRGVEAANATYQASQENLAAVWVSLAAEVATQYIELRTQQRLLEVAQNNLKVQQETLELVEARQKNGLGDDLAVQQARFNLESTRALIPGIRTAMEQVANALGVLTGQLPGTLNDRLLSGTGIPQAPLQCVNGIPANALRQRPDVRRAERLVAAQTARIGQAKSELLPKFRLLGSIGAESFKFDQIADVNSYMYAVNPVVSWPIFHAGSILANVRAVTALQKQTAAEYEAAVLAAVAETRTAIVAVEKERETFQSLNAAVQAAGSAVEISQDKYKNGLVDFNNVLDAQRSQLALQERQVRSEGMIAQDVVRLYKALGGGWQAIQPLMSPAEMQSVGAQMVEEEPRKLK